MRILLSILLSFAIALSALASAAQVRLCCADETCDVAQCMDMGCLPVATPMIAQAATAVPRFTLARAQPREAPAHIPACYHEIWTPPD